MLNLLSNSAGKSPVGLNWPASALISLALGVVSLSVGLTPVVLADPVSGPEPAATVAAGRSAATRFDSAQQILVISPGYEELFGEMFGKGIDLPGGCRLTAGAIDRTAARGTYGCASGEVSMEVVARSTSPEGEAGPLVRRTQKFEIRPVSGTAAKELVDTIESRVREREARFDWSALTREEAPRLHRSASRVGVAVIVFLTLIVLIWMILRRRGAS